MFLALSTRIQTLYVSFLLARLLDCILEQPTDTEVAEKEVLEFPQYKEFAQPLQHYTCFEQIAEGIEACSSFVEPQQVFYKRDVESYGSLKIDCVPPS